MNMVKFLAIIPAFFYSVSAFFAYAQLKNPLKSSTFPALVENVAKIVAEIGFPIAVIALIYAGFLFVTARGNEKKLEDAKRVFFWAMIGTALLVGAWAISRAIQSFVTTL